MVLTVLPPAEEKIEDEDPPERSEKDLTLPAPEEEEDVADLRDRVPDLAHDVRCRGLEDILGGVGVAFGGEDQTLLGVLDSDDAVDDVGGEVVAGAEGGCDGHRDDVASAQRGGIHSLENHQVPGDEPR